MRKTRRPIFRHAAILASLLVLTIPVAAAEIAVMSSGAFTAAYLELLQQFERATHNKVVTLATSIGTGTDSIPSRVARGEGVDVVILNDAALDDMIKAGSVMAGTRVDLARSGIGMAVRAGAPKPDISSIRSLRQTLLN